MRGRFRALRYLRPPLIAIGFLINFASTALSVVQVRGLSLPSWLWITLGTALILSVAIHWIVTLSKENAALQQRLLPQAKIVFDQDKYPACLHESVWPGDAMIDRIFRVWLVNLSDGKTVDDVEVLLAELVGLDRPQDTRFLPVPLAGMTSTSLVAGEVSKSFCLHPGKTPVFVEVAFKRSTVDEISLRYADRWPNTLKPDDRYRLRIVVKSRNAPEVDAWFLMFVDGHDILHFEPDAAK